METFFSTVSKIAQISIEEDGVTMDTQREIYERAREKELKETHQKLSTNQSRILSGDADCAHEYQQKTEGRQVRKVSQKTFPVEYFFHEK